MQPQNASNQRTSAKEPPTDRLFSWKTTKAVLSFCSQNPLVVIVLAFVASMILYPEGYASLAKPSAVDKTKITYPIR